MLWPMKGSPSEPGGSPFGNLHLLARRRRMGRKKKIVQRAVVMGSEEDGFGSWVAAQLV